MTLPFVIIGAGPAGEAAAKEARRLLSPGEPALPGTSGAERRVIVVERDRAGGLCLNRGCVPSKTLLDHVRRTVASGRPVVWADLQRKKREVVEAQRGHVTKGLASAGIELVPGRARFANHRAIEVIGESGDRQTLPFERAVVAVGGESFFPPPLDHHRSLLLDSDRLLDLEQTPKSVAVVGGGAVGCEFACLLHAAGAKVTIIELTDGLLPGEDRTIVEALTRSYERRGIAVKTNSQVADVAKIDGGWRLRLSTNEALDVETVLVCVGRTPELSPLGLEAAGIQYTRRGLALDDRLQTSNPAVFAAGDVATTRLAHAAALQGRVAATNALGGSRRYDGRLVPRCLYSWPEVASVGFWKYQLDERGQDARVSRADFRTSARAMAIDDTDGFVQVVSDPHAGTLLGAQIIGAHATELIHIFSVALAEGMTARSFADVIFAHPTLGETLRDACEKALERTHS